MFPEVVGVFVIIYCSLLTSIWAYGLLLAMTNVKRKKEYDQHESQVIKGGHMVTRRHMGTRSKRCSGTAPPTPTSGRSSWRASDWIINNKVTIELAR